MQIWYKCACLEEEVPLDVPNRLPQTNVVTWVEGPVAGCISFDHHERSPRCLSSEMEYVRIPMDNDAGVGIAKVCH